MLVKESTFISTLKKDELSPEAILILENIVTRLIIRIVEALFKACLALLTLSPSIYLSFFLFLSVLGFGVKF